MFMLYQLALHADTKSFLSVFMCERKLYLACRRKSYLVKYESSLRKLFGAVSSLPFSTRQLNNSLTN